MAQDPYGNEVVDPFDQAIADAVMRSTWWSAGGAAFLALGSNCCCFGVGAAGLGGLAGATPVIILAMFALAASLNVFMRVFTMQPEHKTLVPSWHPIGAALLGLAAFLIASAQLAMYVVPLILMSVASFF